MKKPKINVPHKSEFAFSHSVLKQVLEPPDHSQVESTSALQKCFL